MYRNPKPKPHAPTAGTSGSRPVSKSSSSKCSSSSPCCSSCEGIQLCTVGDGSLDTRRGYMGKCYYCGIHIKKCSHYAMEPVADKKGYCYIICDHMPIMFAIRGIMTCVTDFTLVVCLSYYQNSAQKLHHNVYKYMSISKVTTQKLYTNKQKLFLNYFTSH